ncbi:hypothetical protein O181_029516 [Austropuccinia psidii MF-1]|uniref:Uncharacterized protein n=1 Tax=Austropuccinia psidii MF-1 TaxID=1389203 RepID=A0A9Q3CWM6_9BASI|nr:hypothetical protein [Austropuccinia psidii MF-1]
MLVQHSPPARQTRSQSRSQAFLTPTSRAPLYDTPAVPQLRAHLDRGPNLEGAAPSRKEGRSPRRSSSFSGVVDHFPGFQGPFLKFLVKMMKRWMRILWKKKSLMALKLSLLLWGLLKVLEGQL